MGFIIGSSIKDIAALCAKIWPTFLDSIDRLILKDRGWDEMRWDGMGL
jgi:hypothetical protein